MDTQDHVLVIEQGRTFEEYWAIDLPDGTTVDPEDEITYARLTVKDKHDGTILFDLDSGEIGGIILVYVEDEPNGMVWTGYYYATPSDTALDPWGEAVWDMYVIYQNGKKDTLFRGPAVLILEVAE